VLEYENQQYPRARELLSEIAKNYPNSATAKMAEKRLERMRQENR
jgi:TolA-binding protein